MDQAKKRFLRVIKGIKLSVTQSPTMKEDRKRMTNILYASAIGSLMYIMMCVLNLM
jgi:hypothetical protein